MLGTVSNGSSDFAEQSCFCNETVFFKWDSSTRACICMGNYYFKESSKTCLSCSLVAGTVHD